jgi:spore maturation protein CgeB
MKILLFWSYYDRYTQQIYERNTALGKLPYQPQLDRILADNFSWPPALCKRLEQMGHEVQILIVNAEPLQRAWAQENGCEFNPQNWKYTIPLEQIKQFLPDLVWIGSMFNYYGDYLGEIAPYCKKIFAWAACLLPKSLDLSHIDCMLTSHTNYQSHFKAQGKAAEILLPSFEEDILSKSEVDSRDIDCSFVGSLSYIHIERIEVIKTLAARTPIEIWSEYPKLISRGILQPKFWNAYLKLSSVKSRINPSVWGIDMYRVLAKSKITINVHAEIASGLAGNMRMFEATGMGALLITEDAPNIKELYEPGVEVVTYKGTENLVELINYYIDRPDEREAIATAGQKKTLTTHSTAQRSHELIALFMRYMN